MKYHNKLTKKYNQKYNKKTRRNYIKNPKNGKKFNTSICDDNMTYEECELAILRQAVDETEIIKGEKNVSNEDIKKILKIVEEFIIRKKLICYGGTAVNNILPKSDQFYNRDIEIPDYDFFSENALEDAKELADIYFNSGYTDVEAKSGVHMGTFKVFVNFIPIADITYLVKPLFHAIKKEAIKIAGIYYAPPNYLRMAMYLELSRPQGDVSRWEKVLKRLNLLNKNYPIKPNNCQDVDFQRGLESNTNESEKLYITLRDTFIDLSVIFFGGYATTLYSKYMPKEQQRLLENIPDFDVLSEEPEKTALIIKETLIREKIKFVKIIKHDPIGEIVPECLEIRVGKETVALIYKPIACHSYNKINVNEKEINVATIDTILTFYLAFLYTDMHYYDKDRLLCMAKFLFEVEHKNRLEQRGLLKRFTIDCYGKQETLEEMRSEKAEKFKELKNKRNTREFQMWFLKYVPADSKPQNKQEPVSEDKIDNETTPDSDLKQTTVTPLLQLFGKTENIEKPKKTDKKSDIELSKTSEFLV